MKITSSKIAGGIAMKADAKVEVVVEVEVAVDIEAEAETEVDLEVAIDQGAEDEATVEEEGRHMKNPVHVEVMIVKRGLGAEVAQIGTLTNVKERESGAAEVLVGEQARKSEP